MRTFCESQRAPSFAMALIYLAQSLSKRSGFPKASIPLTWQVFSGDDSVFTSPSIVLLIVTPRLVGLQH